jgi:hypothetical protein
MTKGAKWLFRRGRPWLVLFLYWVVCMTGAGAFARAQGPETGWIIMIMLLLVGVCMYAERGDWKLWQRIGFVPLAWAIHAILSIPAGLVVGFLTFAVRPQLTDRATAFAASIPIVLYAMIHSRLFATKKSPLSDSAGEA